MFGIGKVVSSVSSSISETVNDFVDDPIGTTVDMALQPIHNAYDVLEGLSEGEIRTMAAAKLGADVASGMALSELVEAMDSAGMLD